MLFQKTSFWAYRFRDNLISLSRLYLLLESLFRFSKLFLDWTLLRVQEYFQKICLSKNSRPVFLSFALFIFIQQLLSLGHFWNSLKLIKFSIFTLSACSRQYQYVSFHSLEFEYSSRSSSLLAQSSTYFRRHRTNFPEQFSSNTCPMVARIYSSGFR